MSPGPCIARSLLAWQDEIVAYDAQKRDLATLLIGVQKGYLR